MWDDNFAPETTIDNDAPNVPLGKAAFAFMAILGGLYALYQLVGLTKPEEKRPTPLNNQYSYPWDPRADTEEMRKESEKTREALYATLKK